MALWSGRRGRRLVRRVRRRRRVDRVRAASSGSGPAVSQLGRRRQRPLQVCCRLTQPSATVARAGAVRGPTPMGAARDSDLTISSVECLTRGGSPSRAWANTARAACHQRAPRASARVSHADARGRAAGPLAPPPPPLRRAGHDAALLSYITVAATSSAGGAADCAALRATPAALRVSVALRRRPLVCAATVTVASSRRRLLACAGPHSNSAPWAAEC